MRLTASLQMVATLLGIAICLPTGARAQSQDAGATSQNSSVADAARRSRDKKKSTSKSAKVITDEDLDRRNSQPGHGGFNVGSAPQLETEPPSPQAIASAEASDKASEQQALKDAAEQDAQVVRLKEQVKDAEKDLDLSKRQLALDQDSYFSNPDYAHDAAGKAKLEGEKQQIDDKQQQVERLKTRLAALEELKSRRKPARQQATPPPQTETPANPPPQS
jgi:DNA repair exonuclease SbcCD ATPase subunit